MQCPITLLGVTYWNLYIYYNPCFIPNSIIRVKISLLVHKLPLTGIRLMFWSVTPDPFYSSYTIHYFNGFVYNNLTESIEFFYLRRRLDGWIWFLLVLFYVHHFNESEYLINKYRWKKGWKNKWKMAKMKRKKCKIMRSKPLRVDCKTVYCNYESSAIIIMKNNN